MRPEFSQDSTPDNTNTGQTLNPAAGTVEQGPAPTPGNTAQPDQVLNPDEALKIFFQNILASLKPTGKRKSLEEEEEEQMSLGAGGGFALSVNQNNFSLFQKMADSFMNLLKQQSDLADKGQYPDKTLNQDERQTLLDDVIQPLLNNTNPQLANQPGKPGLTGKLEDSFKQYATEVIKETLGSKEFNQMAQGLGIGTGPQKLGTLVEEIGNMATGAFNLPNPFSTSGPQKK